MFPSLISPGHTQATEQRHLPAELRSCGCFSGVCLQSVSQEGSLERKVPFAQPQHLPGLLCPHVLGHTQYSVGDPHRFSPGIAGVMSLTLREAPDKARPCLQPCRAALAIGRCSAETD